MKIFMNSAGNYVSIMPTKRKKGSSKLKKVVSKAKKLYKSGKAKTWPSAMKKAAKTV